MLKEELSPGVFLIVKWNWDYADYLILQQDLIQRVKEFPKEQYFIICNHPPVLTLGKGLQKNSTNLSLKDWDPLLEKNLPFPLFKIKRGGGLTFHHPGQWIFYPILKLNDKWNLSKLVYGFLEELKIILEEGFSLSSLSIQRAPLGLWRNEKKIASVGIAVEHFITSHGVALNILPGPSLPHSLYPCGLKADAYTDLYSLLAKSPNLMEEFNLIARKKIVDWISLKN